MQTHQTLKDAFCILLLSLFILITTTQGYPLLNHDESRYSEIPREMVATGEYIVPRLNGIIYLEKPPLFYWLQSLSISVFGNNEGAVRFWNAFFASFTCMMLYIAGAVLYDRRTGLVAAGLLFSSLLFYAMAHFISLDMTLSAFVTGSLFCLMIGLHRPQQDDVRRAWIYGSYIFAALALMTKGLVGILLPGSVFVIWMLLTRRFIALKQIYLVSGLLLFFAIALPWHILIQERVPQFFDFYVVGQHFNRYLTLAENRYEPFWFFIPVLLAGLLPWTFYVIPSLYHSCRGWLRNIKGKSTETFLWVWILFIFIFFSLSKSKLIPYILPVFPPIFLLLATDISIFRPSRFPKIKTLLGIGLCAVIIYSVAVPTWTYYADRSIKPLAMLINERKGQYDELVSFGEYYQDLPFYTEQLVTVVNSQGELDFGMTLEDKTDYMINQQTLFKRWENPNHRILMVISRKKYKNIVSKLSPPPKILGETPKHILIMN